MNYWLVLRLGILIGLTIITFEWMNLHVLYRQVRLDSYLGIMALVFAFGGIWLGKYFVKENKKVDSVSTSNLPMLSPMVEIPSSQSMLKELLSVRELEILKMISDGKTNKEIALLAYIELSTVKTHINNIYGKLSVKNRREAKDFYHQQYLKG